MLQDSSSPSTPCHRCEKVPLELRRRRVRFEEMRAAAVELTQQNRRAWAFYRRCRATSHFPADPLTAWYSELLREIYDFVQRVPFEQMSSALEKLVIVLTRKR